MLRKRMPMINWLRKYSSDDALGDSVAGLTVGLTLIPQAIAYASLAGLGPQYGLYSAFAGSFVYGAFGTCKEISIGPTALLSLLTFTYSRGNPEYASLLCFLSGSAIAILGMSRLGFLVDFVSAPVVGGFTSAASLIIACSQIKGLLGLKFQSESFLETWVKLYQQIGTARTADFVLSSCCIATLLTLRKIKDVKTGGKLEKCFWFLGTSRNAIVVITCAAYSYVSGKSSAVPFILTGHIEPGLPSFRFPGFVNGTTGFLEACNALGSGIVVIPLVAVIANVAIIKTFSQGETLDATQEVVTLGICNVVGSFFQSMPVAGSFSRCAVNHASGVRTPFGGLYTSVLVILALTLLTPYFSYIPKATLSAVIMCAVIFMIEFNMIKSIWKCNKRDLVPALITFFSCLLMGVELGILVGILTDLSFLIHSHARPAISIDHKNIETLSYILVRPSAGLTFPVVDHLKTRIMKTLSKSNQKTEFVVLDGERINGIDFTAVQGIVSMTKILKDANRRLVLMNVRPDILNSVESFSTEPVSSIKLELDLERMHISNDDFTEINSTRV